MSVDKKKFEIRDVKSMPFGKDHVEILSADKADIQGALLPMIGGTPEYRAFFTYSLKKGEEKVFTLPPRTCLVFIQKKEGCFYYIDDQNTVSFNSRELE